eukprot:scaffold74024_cov36-Tisochrysis_lutea.AAC.2
MSPYPLEPSYIIHADVEAHLGQCLRALIVTPACQSWCMLLPEDRENYTKCSPARRYVHRVVHGVCRAGRSGQLC